MAGSVMLLLLLFNSPEARSVVLFEQDLHAATLLGPVLSRIDALIGKSSSSKGTGSYYSSS